MLKEYKLLLIVGWYNMFLSTMKYRLVVNKA